MDFSAEGILRRMKDSLVNEDTKQEGSFSMDNLQAVSEEMARIYSTQLLPLAEMLTDKEEDMGTCGNERHYQRWAKEATDENGEMIVGNAKVNAPRDGTGLVSIAILTKDATPPSQEQIAIVQAYIDNNKPVGAGPIVSAAEGYEVTVQCNVVAKSGYTDETVRQSIARVLQDYFVSIAFSSGDTILNFYTVTGVISAADGVAEVLLLKLNGEKESITTDFDKYFTLREVIVNVAQ